MLVGGANERREDDPLAAYALIFSLISQIANGRGVCLRQPQHAGVNPRHQPHPERKHLGRDLVEIVKSAEDKAVIGQARLRTGRRALRNPSRSVVWHVAIWKINDLFVVIRLM